MKFNMNGYVKVKLNDSGIEELKRRHEELYKKLPLPMRREFDLKLDKDGYYKIQLWSLMSTFGHLIQLGTVSPFDTDIIFPLSEKQRKEVCADNPDNTSDI